MAAAKADVDKATTLEARVLQELQQAANARQVRNPKPRVSAARCEVRRQVRSPKPRVSSARCEALTLGYPPPGAPP
eukprot:4733238-Pyramimonas_sp.AAC.1